MIYWEYVLIYLYFYENNSQSTHTLCVCISGKECDLGVTINIDGNTSLPNIELEFFQSLDSLISKAHIELINYSIHSLHRFFIYLFIFQNFIFKRQFLWDKFMVVCYYGCEYIQTESSSLWTVEKELKTFEERVGFLWGWIHMKFEFQSLKSMNTYIFVLNNGNSASYCCFSLVL